MIQGFLKCKMPDDGFQAKLTLTPAATEPER